MTKSAKTLKEFPIAAFLAENGFRLFVRGYQPMTASGKPHKGRSASFNIGTSIIINDAGEYRFYKKGVLVREKITASTAAKLKESEYYNSFGA